MDRLPALGARRERAGARRAGRRRRRPSTGSWRRSAPTSRGALLDGEPARELARAGRELDLLVCGSRPAGPLTRLLLGSTSECLAREAPCPVMVLPGGMPEHVLRDDPAWIAAHAS